MNAAIRLGTILVFTGLFCASAAAQTLHLEGTFAEEILWTRPEHVLTDAAGSIYISDPRQQVVHRFSADREHVGTFGAKGSGPREFQSINEMAWSPDGELVILDGRARRLSIWSIDGVYLRQQAFTDGVMVADLAIAATWMVSSDDHLGLPLHIDARGLLYSARFDPEPHIAVWRIVR